MKISNEIVATENQPKWLELQERAKARALQFMRDPDLDKYAKDYIIGSLAKSTLVAYAADLKIFRLWCEDRGVPYLPASPAMVANFLAAQASLNNPPLKVSTIQRRVAAIRYAHFMAEQEVLPTDSFVVKKTIKGIMRQKLTAPDQKSPATNDLIHLMADVIDTTNLVGIRDRALLLLGFAGAFRRSELVSLRISDLKIHEQGMDVFIRKSKTDQTGEGATKPIIRGESHCPVEAVQHWLRSADLTEGYLFRRITKSGLVWPAADSEKPELSAQSVALIVKKYAQLIGLDATKFAGHSLRHGFNTSAFQNGASIEKVMSVSLQKDPKTVLRYFQDTKKYESHAGKGLL